MEGKIILKIIGFIFLGLLIWAICVNCFSPTIQENDYRKTYTQHLNLDNEKITVYRFKFTKGDMPDFQDFTRDEIWYFCWMKTYRNDDYWKLVGKGKNGKNRTLKVFH